MDPNTIPTPTPNPAPNPVPTPNPTPAAPAPQPPIPEPAEAPVYQPSQPIAAPTIEATDPITMPDPLPEPDPVEEALKQPIKPADPVPGSIGSAVSMPPLSATPDITAAEPAMPNPMMAAPAPAKKSNKTTVILLAILAAIIILGLGAFLIMQLVGQAPSNNPTSPETPTEEDPTPVLSTLTCKRTLEEIELAGIGNATKGTENLFADYEDGILTTIERGWSLEFADTAAADAALTQLKTNYEDTFTALELDADPFDSKYDNQEGVVEINHIAAAEDLDDANMSIFELAADEDDKIATDSKSLTAAYETLGFTCNEE